MSLDTSKWAGQIDREIRELRSRISGLEQLKNKVAQMSGSGVEPVEAPVKRKYKKRMPYGLLRATIKEFIDDRVNKGMVGSFGTKKIVDYVEAKTGHTPSTTALSSTLNEAISCGELKLVQARPMIVIPAATVEQLNNTKPLGERLNLNVERS